MRAFFVLILVCSISIAHEDQQTIEQRIADANTSYSNRNFQEAIQKFQPLLQLLEAAGDQQQTGDILFKLGRSHRRLGNFPEAHQFLNRALQLHTSLSDKEGIAFDLSEIGIAHQRQGNYDESLKFSEKAIAIHREIHNSLGLARTLDNFGNTYYRLGKHELAAKNFEEGVQAAIDSGDKEVLNVVLSNLGQVYAAMGDYPLALETYRQSRQLAEEIKDLNAVATNLANSALLYRNQGDVRRGILDLEKAHVLFLQVGNKPLIANNLFNLGLFLFDSGNYAKAVEYLHESLKLAEELEDKGLAAYSLDALAGIEHEIGSYDAAMEHVRKSLKISKEIGEKTGITSSLANLARISVSQGDEQAALKYLREAVQIDRQSGEKKTLQDLLRELGVLHTSLNDLDRGLEAFEEALSIQTSLGMKAEMGLSHTMIGSIYRRQGNLAAAEAEFKKAIPLVTEVNLPDYMWPAFYNQALLSEDRDELRKAIDWMKQAVQVIEGIREGIGLPEHKSSYLQKRLDVYEDLIRLLVKTQRVEEAYEYVQRSKTRAFLDRLAESRIDPQGNLNAAQYDEKRKLLAKLIRLNAQIKEERGTGKINSATIQKLERTRDQTDDQYLKLQLQIRKENPRYAELQNPEILSLEQSQNLLSPHTVLLDYFVGKKESVVFAVTREQAHLFSLPGEKKLNEQITEMLALLQKPEPVWETTHQSHSKYVALANVLYLEILKPAESVGKNKSHVIVAPDGPLSYLPFETLLTSRPKTIDFARLPYYALDREIQYVPSVSALAAISRNTSGAAAKELIAFADPLGNKPASAGTGRENPAPVLAELPHARAEVHKISQLYPKEKVFTLVGKEASEANAKGEQLKNFRIVHFASHGLIDEERPQLSALVLNTGNPNEDGYLTMREVFDLKLNADLVVLSACKSGLGQRMRGEGVTGLARAFFCAGASSVLVSLWNVNDQSTAEFMTEFYRSRVQDGLSKTAALKHARLKMLRGNKYSHPYYWSPFILIGAR